jgi:hypothetical protein
MPRLDIKDYVRWLPCPGCGQPMRWQNDGEIEIIAESRQFVTIEGLWTADDGCENPFCKWSRI